MSPNRRQFLTTIAGGAMSLAIVASVGGGEPDITEWEEIVAIRAAVRNSEARRDWRRNDDAIGQELWLIGTMLDGVMLDLCPHGAKTWRVVPNATRSDDDLYERCDACDAMRRHRASCLWWGDN